MLILLIDSAADICSVSIINREKIIDSIEIMEKNIHSEKLTVMIDQLFEKNNISIKALTAVGINRGPGSYTGLRIGSAVAKGICFALDIPLLSCDGLLAYACSIINESENTFDYVITALDARRDEVYITILDHNLNILVPTQPMILDENYNKLLETQCQGNIGIFSNCVEKMKRLTKVNNVYISGNEYFKSVYLRIPIVEQLDKKIYENLSYFEPNYIKVGYNVN